VQRAYGTRVKKHAECSVQTVSYKVIAYVHVNVQNQIIAERICLSLHEKILQHQFSFAPPPEL
jgi:hypothetical protein